MLLLLALGCGLVASVGINQVLANRRNTPEGKLETTPIFVALKDIGIGDLVKPEFIKLEEWPTEKVPAGAVTKLEQLEGRCSRVKFFPGEPILEVKLLGKGEHAQGATGFIRPGYRVVGVRVDAQSSGGNLILPGDRVDVMVHIAENPGRQIFKTATLTFMQNVKVFAVDDVFNREKDGDNTIAAKTISLEILPHQTELVTLAQKLGEIQFAIRNATDESIEDSTTGVTAEELLRGTDKSEPPTEVASSSTQGNPLLDLLGQHEPKSEPKTEPQASPIDEPATEAAAEDVFKMVIYRGNEASEVEFHEGSRVGVVSPKDGTLEPPLAPEPPLTLDDEDEPQEPQEPTKDAGDKSDPQSDEPAAS